jgi:transcription initiation factor TFIIB
VLAAAVYISCRETGTPRTIKDIAITSTTKEKDVARCYRLVVFELGIKIPVVDPMKCVAKVANKLSLTQKTRHLAVNMMEEAVEKKISAGEDPMGFAASVIYASCIKTGEDISQINMAKAAGITEVTIRNRFKDLSRNLRLN